MSKLIQRRLAHMTLADEPQKFNPTESTPP